MYNTDSQSMMATSKFDQFKLYRIHPSMTSRILFYSNDLAIWHGFPDITHIKVNNGRHFIELQFFRAFSSME